VVVRISSHQIAEARARLSSEAAARAARLGDMDIRMEVVSATLAAAEHREAVAMESKTQLDESYKKGLLPALTRTAAAEQAYHGQKDAEALRAEKRALTDQIKMLTIATEQADLALSDLLDLFDQGRLHAPSPVPSMQYWPIAARSCALAMRCWSWLANTGLLSLGFPSGDGTVWRLVEESRSMQGQAHSLE
jgi:hypothetical protein